MTPINFRLLEAKDRESCRQIRLECLTSYPEFFGDTYEEEINAPNLKFDKALRLGDRTSFLMGAFSEDSLVGICGFIQDGRMKTSHRGELVDVYIDPSFSSHGIGNELLGLTIAKIFENNFIDHVLLSVVNTNEKAINLYKKHGFVQYGILENYFNRGNDSWAQLFMVLTRKDFLTKKR